MKVLVTGGAGYVGSHAVRALLQAGHQVWVYDNLSCGHAASVPEGELIVADLADQQRLEAELSDKRIDAVLHFAALALVGESVTNPAIYYQNNVVGTLKLLEAMRKTGVWRLVFSSTTATYGVPEQIPITEQERQDPINPYGFTKLVIEHAMADYATAYGMGYAALRYFNASGAASDSSIGEDHKPESHLIPLVLQVALGQREQIAIFGTDYPTPDGTCIRDYVHVEDLASAHVKALERLRIGSGLKLNLGTGHGQSVRQVIEACCKVSGVSIRVSEEDRRPGDPPELVADSTLAQKTLEWTPRYTDIESIVQTAWAWHSTHPAGFDSTIATKQTI